MPDESVCEFCYDSYEGHRRLSELLRGGQGRSAREIDSSASWLGWLLLICFAALIAWKVLGK